MEITSSDKASINTNLKASTLSVHVKKEDFNTSEQAANTNGEKRNLSLSTLLANTPPSYECRICGEMFMNRKTFFIHKSTHKKGEKPQQKYSNTPIFKKQLEMEKLKALQQTNSFVSSVTNGAESVNATDQKESPSDLRRKPLQFFTEIKVEEGLPKFSKIVNHSSYEHRGNQEMKLTNVVVTEHSSGSLEKNVASMLKQKVYKCGFCGKDFTKKKTYTNHKDNHKKNKKTGKTFGNYRRETKNK